MRGWPWGPVTPVPGYRRWRRERVFPGAGGRRRATGCRLLEQRLKCRASSPEAPVPCAPAEGGMRETWHEQTPIGVLAKVIQRTVWLWLVSVILALSGCLRGAPAAHYGTE